LLVFGAGFGASFFTSTFLVSGAFAVVGAVVGLVTFFTSVNFAVVAFASLPVCLTALTSCFFPFVSATLVSSYFSCFVLNLVTNL